MLINSKYDYKVVIQKVSDSDFGEVSDTWLLI